MATGWAHDGAVQEQIDSSIEDAVQRVRQQLPQGPSAEHCRNCDALIPEGRRLAIPGVQLCTPANHLKINKPASAVTIAAAVKTVNCAEISALLPASLCITRLIYLLTLYRSIFLF